MKRKTKKTTKKVAAKKTVTKTVTTITTTTVVTGALKNRIGIVMDASSSMDPMRDEVVAAFNGQVDTIKANNKDMDTKVSLLTFSTVPDEFKILNQPVDGLRKITRDDYAPNGWTALYDAIGKMVSYFESLPEFQDSACSFLMVILTDGAENQSRNWTFQAVNNKIKALEATGRWTFTYLGANEGLKDVGTSLGMSRGNTISGQSLRMPGAYSNLSTSSMRSFMTSRTIGAKAVTNFYDPQNGSGSAGDAGDAVPTLNDDSHVTTTTTAKPSKAKQGQS